MQWLNQRIDGRRRVQEGPKSRTHSSVTMTTHRSITLQQTITRETSYPQTAGLSDWTWHVGRKKKTREKAARWCISCIIHTGNEQRSLWKPTNLLLLYAPVFRIEIKALPTKKQKIPAPSFCSMGFTSQYVKFLILHTYAHEWYT